MENKNINTGSSLNKNLLTDKEFKSIIRFEADYAALLKGGHQPGYYSGKQQARLVNEVNLLTPLETVQFVKSLFTGKN